ncbi:hypothetical protein K3495_g15420, partial [Podosphaera aphanis]
MLYEAQLPHQMWDYAIEHAVWIKNKSPTTALPFPNDDDLNRNTPHSAYFKRPADLENLRVFGCKADILYPSILNPQKWQARTRQGKYIMVGMTSSKIWKLLDTLTLRETVSADAKFNEYDFPRIDIQRFILPDKPEELRPFEQGNKYKPQPIIARQKGVKQLRQKYAEIRPSQEDIHQADNSKLRNMDSSLDMANHNSSNMADKLSMKNCPDMANNSNMINDMANNSNMINGTNMANHYGPDMANHYGPDMANHYGPDMANHYGPDMANHYGPDMANNSNMINGPNMATEASDQRSLLAPYTVADATARVDDAIYAPTTLQDAPKTLDEVLDTLDDTCHAPTSNNSPIGDYSSSKPDNISSKLTCKRIRKSKENSRKLEQATNLSNEQAPNSPPKSRYGRPLKAMARSVFNHLVTTDFVAAQVVHINHGKSSPIEAPTPPFESITIEQAMHEDPYLWKEAIKLELESLHNTNTYTILSGHPPLGKKIISSKIVLRKKFKSD